MSRRYLTLDLRSRAGLFAHLGAMERAGVPIDRALFSLDLGTRHEAAVKRLRQMVGGGRDLASSGQLSGVFTPLESGLIRAAQEAGALAHVYEQLAQRYDEQARHAAELKSRLLLPAGVLLLALAVKPLPSLVAGSLSGAGYLAAVLLPVLWLAALLFGARALWRRWQQWRSDQPGPLNDLLLALPILGSLQLRADIRNFCDSLGLLLEAGMPVLDALPRACNAVTNARLRRDFANLAPRVAAGQSLVRAFDGLSLHGKAMLIGVLNTGEATGRPGEALLRFARLQAQQLAASQQMLASWAPRLFYLAVAGWMAYGLLTGGGFFPALPAELAGR
ncbi:type II secretion system F family protein [Ectopseudomonas toyotomiensis]|uniref:type II secretion system F family protein n=1 Tax=Ectopseudomonas toyotomiensis TaxID=554344 RepID=UPI0018C36EDA|nr:type II secretion system F family protein [Pseudomonas toyotomiensis]MBG0841887.1 type II secretion system F family protein [Pseudomonas toyotomiensis]